MSLVNVTRSLGKCDSILAGRCPLDSLPAGDFGCPKHRRSSHQARSKLSFEPPQLSGCHSHGHASCLLTILEQDLQGQLTDSRVAGAENISEPAPADSCIRDIEVGAVEEVKELRAKLKLQMLFN
jgi:hypothetical protein